MLLNRKNIVKFHDNHGIFFAFEEEKQMTNKKTHPSEGIDILVWPLENEFKESNKHRIGLQRIFFCKNKDGNVRGLYGNSNDGKIEGGKAVHTTIFMVTDLGQC